MTHEERDQHTAGLLEQIGSLEGIIKTLLPNISTITLNEEKTNNFLVSLSGYQRRDENGFEIVSGDLVGVPITLYRNNNGSSVLTLA